MMKLKCRIYLVYFNIHMNNTKYFNNISYNIFLVFRRQKRVMEKFCRMAIVHRSPCLEMAGNLL